MKKKQMQLLIERQQAIVTAAREAGRDMTDEEQRNFDDLQGQINTLRPEVAAEEEQAASAARAAAVKAERERTVQINTICRQFGADPSKFISDGSTVDQVREAIMNDMVENGAPSSVHVQRDEGDKFRSAAADAIVMRSGYTPEHPADGAEDMRGLSLRDLAIECQSREHGAEMGSLLRMAPSDLYDNICRDFYNPSAAFPAIMDTAIKKSIVHIYNSVGTTFQMFTRKGQLHDFKRTDGHNYLIGGVGDLLLVPENGELKADTHDEQTLPQRQLKTYGRQFSMSRQAFINDDIGFISEVPGMYAAKAKRQINKAVYGILYANGTIYDGKTLFNAEHKNLMGTASAPTNASIQAMIQKLQLQQDPFGEQIMIAPDAIIVPVGYGFLLQTIFESQTINTADNQQAANPLYKSKIRVAEDAVLNGLAGTGTCPWFMSGAQSDVMGIEVDYLNGQETPTFRRSEASGQLGFVWDIYLDWGITVMDYRGFVKNPGVKLATE